MQTFLPYPDFQQTAVALDYRRLGKQRLEAQQILRALTIGGGWAHHPATLMWQGHEQALKQYYNVIVQEWINRGYRNTMPILEIDVPIIYPDWLGRDDFHRAHRAALLAKDFAFYGRYGWSEEPMIEYVWPIRVGDK